MIMAISSNPPSAPKWPYLRPRIQPLAPEWLNPGSMVGRSFRNANRVSVTGRSISLAGRSAATRPTSYAATRDLAEVDMGATMASTSGSEAGPS